MKATFYTAVRHTVTEANINCYAVPFVHPPRKMKEHDFIYMLDGEWKIGQNDDVFTLKKDTLLILSANNRHYGVSPCERDTKTMYFHVSCETGEGLIDDDAVQSDEFDALESLLEVSANPAVKKYFYEIVNAKLSGDDRKANIFFDLLLCELSALQKHPRSTEIGEQIKTIIHQNPERFFRNTELAGMVGVSTKTAENRFKLQFGMTIHQYILRFKIEQAIASYKNFPEMSVKEIAYNLGFYDEYHFSKQFKKITGMSPSQYRTEWMDFHI